MLIITEVSVNAQCPGCLSNMSCGLGSTEPSICPDSLSDGTVGQSYDQDITFFVPQQVAYNVPGVGVVNVNVNWVLITGITGLPYGIEWQSGSSNNTFYPGNNPPDSQYGCVKLCGTPMIAGTYTITAAITAQGSYGLVTQSEQFEFELSINIIAGSSNSGFSMSNISGCDSLQVTFNALIASNGSTDYYYSWNFGNGNTSLLENPPVQNYTVSGTYPVSLNTTIFEEEYNITNLNVTQCSCNDNLISPGAPDLFFVLKQGTNVLYASSIVNNSYTASFTFGPVVLNNTTYTIEVWDDDVLFDPDDLCGSVNFIGFQAGYHTLSNSGLTVNFTVNHITDSIQLNNNDTVNVYPVPFVNLGNDSNITSGSITLNAGSGFDNYLWSNGTTIDSLTVSLSGTYSVTVASNFGCTAFDEVNLIFGNSNIDIVTTDVTCTGLTNGSADLTIIGTGPFSYLWSNQATTQDINDLSPGIYSVTVSQGLSVFSTLSIEINVPQPLIPVFAITDAGCETCSDGAIDLSMNGGITPYIFGWSNGASTEDIAGLLPGTYNVYILDNNNCYTYNLATVDFSITGLQIISLVQGWSIFSTYIDPFCPLFDSVFSSLTSQTIIVKNGEGLVFWPQYNINGIGDMAIGKGYQVKMITSQALNISGEVIIPENTPLEVPSGWSIIGYLRQNPGLITDMIYGISSNIRIMKSGGGDVFWPQFNLNTIISMNPGEGYQLNMISADTLTYPAN